ncbi:hypothetical protein NST83_17220 [Paenibacillus sp. FSL R10-2782]|uniref:hypothetical protein n=1 Tax=Paenibacillus sp. FSL R10-2782 TaxID=2954661 RepID=UPI0031588103
MFLKSKGRSSAQTIAGWKSAITSDITDLLQRQTLIGRDKRFYIISTNQIIQVSEAVIASKDLKKEHMFCII